MDQEKHGHKNPKDISLKELMRRIDKFCLEQGVPSREEVAHQEAERQPTAMELWEQSNEPLVDEHPIVNGLRYFTMRLARLIGAVASEAFMFTATGLAALGFVLGVQSLFYSTKKWNTEMTAEYFWSPWRVAVFCHPWVSLFVGIALVYFFYGLSMSFGAPYRFKWRVPGSGVIRCEHCHGAVTDNYTCVKCGSARAVWLGTAAVRLLNRAIMVPWVIHDCVMFMFWFVKVV